MGGHLMSKQIREDTKMTMIASYPKLVVPRRRQGKPSALNELKEWQLELQRMRDFRRCDLSMSGVLIPYVKQLSLPIKYVITRRAFWVLLELIRYIAYLRHEVTIELGTRRGSPAAKESIIVANIDDYRQAYDILSPLLKVIYAPMVAIGLPTPDELADALNSAEGTSNE